MYLLANKNLNELERYAFKNEEELQKLLFEHPQIVLNIPELEIGGAEIVIKYREYGTSRGPVDVLYITKNADIFVIETKLIRNPESIRTVIAQIVDYIKAITTDGFSSLLGQSHGLYKFIADGFVADDRFCSLLSKNVQTGNITGIVIGDDIHPNLLGLVESVQSAPHLAFHIELVKTEAFWLDNNIIINAVHVENTKEVERSVIRITFDMSSDKTAIAPAIDSESPSKEGQGSKPKLKWEEYINTVEDKIRPLINSIEREWVDLFGKKSISMGTVGFSAGFIVGNKRIPVLFVYDDYMELIMAKDQKRYGAPDESYAVYKSILEKTPDIYDKLISGKRLVIFDEFPLETLNNVFIASLEYAKSWESLQEKNE